MNKNNDFPKELEGLISPEKLEALRQLVKEMRAKGYAPIFHSRPPDGTPPNCFVIDFEPINDRAADLSQAPAPQLRN